MEPKDLVRLAYLSGPVDAGDVYVRWKAGRHTQLFGTSYLMQFFELCSELGADALVITTLPTTFSRKKLGNIIVENRPPPQSRGLRYHLAMLLWMLRLAPTLLSFKPAAFVITAHQNYWFALSYAKLLGTELIPSAHCVLWRPFGSTPLHWRLLLWLDGLFLQWCVRRAMAISTVVSDQLKRLAKSRNLEVAIITPTYARGHFDGIAPPDHERRPFRVVFNGRTEANKGIFDLVYVAGRANRERHGEFHFDVCGDGLCLETLRAMVAKEGLEHMTIVHGFCNSDKLGGLLSKSHAVIVPTRSDFEEGLAKSCVEAVLAHRPFVTSAVCPALVTLNAAAVEVPPDDADGYFEALILLADSATLYRRKSEACYELQGQFYQSERSYRETLRRVLSAAGIISFTTTNTAATNLRLPASNRL